MKKVLFCILKDTRHVETASFTPLYPPPPPVVPLFPPLGSSTWPGLPTCLCKVAQYYLDQLIAKTCGTAAPSLQMRMTM